MKQVCLFTATGAENLGDELITACEIRTLLSSGEKQTITVFSHDTERTRRFLISQKIPMQDIILQRYFPDAFRKHPLKNIRLFWETLTTLKRTDRVYIGGGGLLYSRNEEGHSPLKLWCLRAMIARFFGKPLTYLSLGISTTRGELKPYAKYLFSGNTITVREKQSQDTLQALGYPSSILPDPVFTYVSSEVTSSDKPTKTIGIALRKGGLSEEAIMQILKKLIARGYEILLLPHSLHPTDEGSHDGYYLQRFLLPGVTTTQSIEQTLEGYRKCHLIISMRLHSMILAIDHHIPFIALSYAKKTNSLLADTAWKYAFPEEEVAPEDILDAVEKIESEYEPLSRRLSDIHGDLRRAYDAAIEKLLCR